MMSIFHLLWLFSSKPTLGREKTLQSFIVVISDDDGGTVIGEKQ
jgi:hypothetical protein